MTPAGNCLLDTTYCNRVLWGKVAVYFIIAGGWLFVCLLTDSETKTKRGERQTVSKIEMGLQRCDDPSRCWTKRWNTTWKATEGTKDVKPQTDVSLCDTAEWGTAKDCTAERVERYINICPTFYFLYSLTIFTITLLNHIMTFLASCCTNTFLSQHSRTLYLIQIQVTPQPLKVKQRLVSSKC